MKSKIEKMLYRESSKLVCPTVLSNVYQSIGYEEKKKKFFTKRKTIIFSTVIYASLVCGIVLPVTLNNKSTKVSEAFVNVTINPKSLSSSSSKETQVDFYVSKNNKVASFIPESENGKIVTSNLSLQNQTVEESTYAVLNNAITTGIVDASSQNNYISIFVTCDNQKIKNSLQNSISKKIINTLKEKYIYGKIVLPEQDYIDTSSYSLYGNKFLLINKINEYYPNVYTLDYLATLPLPKLLDLIKSYDDYHMINSEHNTSKENYDFEIKDLQNKYSETIKNTVAQIDEIQVNNINPLQVQIQNLVPKHDNMIDHYSYQVELFDLLSSFDSFNPGDSIFFHENIWEDNHFKVSQMKGDKDEKEEIVNLRAQIQEYINQIHKLEDDLKDELGDYFDEKALIFDQYKDSFDFFEDDYYEHMFNDFSQANPPKDHDENWQEDYRDHYHDDDQFFYHP